MKALASLGIALSMVGAQCYAATVSGKLMDAKCYNEKKIESREAGHKVYDSITKDCAATPASAIFALRVTSGDAFHQYEGDTLKLDDNGNSLAAAAFRDGRLQADKDGHVHIRAKGKVMTGEVLMTKSLDSSHHRVFTNTANVK